MVLSSSTIKDGPPSPLEKANREINQNLNVKLGFIEELAFARCHSGGNPAEILSLCSRMTLRVRLGNR